MTKEQRDKISRVEQFVAVEYNRLMLEGGDELPDKLAGLFGARDIALREILGDEYDKIAAQEVTA